MSEEQSYLFTADGSSELLTTDLPNYPCVTGMKSLVGFACKEEVWDLLEATEKEVMKEKVKNGLAKIVDSPEGKLIRFPLIQYRMTHYHPDLGNFVCMTPPGKGAVPAVCCKTLIDKPAKPKLGAIIIKYNLDSDGDPLVGKNGRIAYELYQLIFDQRLYNDILSQKKYHTLLKSDMTLVCENADYKTIKGTFAGESIWQKDPETAKDIVQRTSGHWTRIVSKLGKPMTEEKFRQTLALSSNISSKQAVPDMSKDVEQELAGLLSTADV